MTRDDRYDQRLFSTTANITIQFARRFNHRAQTYWSEKSFFKRLSFK